MRLLLALAATVQMSTASASWPVQSPVEDFYRQSSRVVYAQVVSGEIVKKGDYTCGVTYRLKVLRQFKSDGPTEIEMVSYVGAQPPRIGAKYVAFLSDRDGHDLLNVVENQGLAKDKLIACSTVEKETFASLILEEQFNNGQESLIVPEAAVAFPLTVHKSCGVPSFGNYSVLELAWVTTADAFAYLDGLREPGGAPN